MYVKTIKTDLSNHWCTTQLIYLSGYNIFANCSLWPFKNFVTFHTMKSMIQAFFNVFIKVICTLYGTRVATSNKVLTKQVFIKLERWGHMYAEGGTFVTFWGKWCSLPYPFITLKWNPLILIKLRQKARCKNKVSYGVMAKEFKYSKNLKVFQATTLST